MSFDSSTLNFLLITLIVVGIWGLILWSNTRSMHKQLIRVAQQQSAIRQNDEVRQLCRAVHYLHPTLHAGIDYSVSDGGPDQKPYISQWRNTHIPQPGREELDRALQAISGVDPVKDHAAQRLSEYPSIGDQLDAAYKARQGDDSEQVRLDGLIAQVKQKYPKSDETL